MKTIKKLAKYLSYLFNAFCYICFDSAAYKMIFPYGINKYLRKELQDCETVLDLGCGDDTSPVRHISVPYSVGVELFEPYLKRSKEKNIHNEYILGDMRKVEFKPNSFDAVLAIGVIEHLNKEDGFEFIEKMKGWAKKKMVLFTPNGYVWQDSCDNNPLQVHRTGWSVDEFRNLGFEVYGISGLKYLRGYHGGVRFKPFGFWRVIADLTQKITYHHPEYAFEFFCVKRL